MYQLLHLHESYKGLAEKIKESEFNNMHSNIILKTITEETLIEVVTVKIDGLINISSFTDLLEDFILDNNFEINLLYLCSLDNGKSFVSLGDIRKKYSFQFIVKLNSDESFIKTLVAPSESEAFKMLMKKYPKRYSITPLNAIRDPKMLDEDVKDAFINKQHTLKINKGKTRNSLFNNHSSTLV